MLNTEKHQLYLSYVNSIYNEIANICNPLKKYLGISNFGYLQIFFDSSYFYVCNDLELIKEYVTTINETNIFFEKQLFFPKASNEFHYILWPKISLNRSMDLYMKRNYWHGLTFTKAHSNHVELWWFATDTSNTNINDFYKSNIDVLEKFVFYFRNKTRDIINSKNKILANFNKGVDLSQVNNFINTDVDQKKIEQFLKEIGFTSIHIRSHNGTASLSPREVQCLYFLSLGNTMKEIAYKTDLSPRTVESYLNNLRYKTGYKCRSSLVKFYHDEVAKYV